MDMYKQSCDHLYTEHGDELLRLVDMAGECLLSGGQIVYGGSGAAGILAMVDASECVPTFGSGKLLVHDSDSISAITIRIAKFLFIVSIHKFCRAISEILQKYPTLNNNRYSSSTSCKILGQLMPFRRGVWSCVH